MQAQIRSMAATNTGTTEAQRSGEAAAIPHLDTARSISVYSVPLWFRILCSSVCLCATALCLPKRSRQAQCPGRRKSGRGTWPLKPELQPIRVIRGLFVFSVGRLIGKSLVVIGDGQGHEFSCQQRESRVEQDGGDRQACDEADPHRLRPAVLKK